MVIMIIYWLVGEVVTPRFGNRYFLLALPHFSYRLTLLRLCAANIRRGPFGDLQTTDGGCFELHRFSVRQPAAILKPNLTSPYPIPLTKYLMILAWRAFLLKFVCTREYVIITHARAPVLSLYFCATNNNNIIRIIRDVGGGTDRGRDI